MKTVYEPTKATMSRRSSGSHTLIRQIAELTEEVERLRDDNLQLRAAVSIYSDLARKALPELSS